MAQEHVCWVRFHVPANTVYDALCVVEDAIGDLPEGCESHHADPRADAIAEVVEWLRADTTLFRGSKPWANYAADRVEEQFGTEEGKS